MTVAVDRLQELLQHQNALSERVSLSRDAFISLQDADRVMWVERYLKAFSSELRELADEMFINRDLTKARQEWIDLQFFTWNLSFVLGFDTSGQQIQDMLGIDSIDGDALSRVLTAVYEVESTEQGQFNCSSLVNTKFDPNSEGSPALNNHLLELFLSLERIRGCLAFKWWKKNQTNNWDRAQNEWMFLQLHLWILGFHLGFEPNGDTLHQMYLVKMKINHDRQDNGY